MAPQTVRTGFLLFCLYLVFTPGWAVEYEMVNALLYFIILPVIMITPVIIVCLFIGLPLRYSPLHERWLRLQWLVVTGMAGGILLFSTVTPVYFPNVLMLTVGQWTQLPLQLLPTAGWVLFAFSSLHFYPKMLLKHRKTR